MSIVSREQLKAWFRRGMKPLESQFATWIDSFWHKEDSIPMTSISGLGEALNARTISIDEALDEESENPVQNKVVTAALATKEELGKVVVDTANRLLKVQEGGMTYVCGLEPLEAPAAPSLSGDDEVTSTTDQVEFTLVNNTPGATIHYTLDGSDPRTSQTAQTGTTVSVSGVLSAEESEFTLRAAALRNGLWSGLLVDTLVVQRKVAQPTATASGNDYSTSRTVTLACSTPGVTLRYTTDGSVPTTSTGTVYSEPFPISASATVKVIAVATGWVSSEVRSASYTVGAKKAFYGFSTASALANAAAIQALASTGGSQEKTKLQGALTITPTGNTAGYIWLCCTGTLTPNTIVPNQGDVIPFGFEAAITVDGWHCYRSTNAINPEQTNVYIP